jgi:hypothetical protein
VEDKCQKCEKEWLFGNGYCYLMVNSTEVKWCDATSYCDSMNASLLTLDENNNNDATTAKHIFDYFSKLLGRTAWV